MNKVLFHAAALLAALCVFGSAWAAADDTLMHRTAQLIASPNVAADIKLSSGQTKKRDDLISDYQTARQKLVERMLDGPESERDARQADLDNLLGKLEEDLLALLTPGQSRRLMQIGIQQEGVVSLQDDQVARELSLSAAQRAKIKACYDVEMKAQDAYQQALGDALDKIPEPTSTDEASLKAFKEKQDSVVKSLKPKENDYLSVKSAQEKQMVASLTPAQKKKWSEMHGKPMKSG